MKNTTYMQKGEPKLNKDKYHFRCTLVPFFGKTISRQDMRPDLRMLDALIDIPVKNGITGIPWCARAQLISQHVDAG